MREVSSETGFQNEEKIPKARRQTDIRDRHAEKKDVQLYDSEKYLTRYVYPQISSLVLMDNHSPTPGQYRELVQATCKFGFLDTLGHHRVIL